MPLPAQAGGVQSARAARWRDLINPVDARRLALVLDVSLEAPLLGPGAGWTGR